MWGGSPTNISVGARRLGIDDVLAAPIAARRIFQFGGMNLSKEPCRSATLFAVEIARRAGVEVVLDISGPTSGTTYAHSG